jgi:hypothetical protein
MFADPGDLALKRTKCFGLPDQSEGVCSIAFLMNANICSKFSKDDRRSSFQMVFATTISYHDTGR